MSAEPNTFPALMRDFAAAVETGSKSASSLPFISLQFSALLNHKTETDDDKRRLTGMMSGLAVRWLSYCSRPEYSGEFNDAAKILHPMLDALQAPQAIAFVSPENVQKIADSCIALAQNGPALLHKAGPHDDTASSIKLKQDNREALLALTERALEFINKCKEYREGITFDPKTTKDIAPVKRIELKAGANSHG